MSNITVDTINRYLSEAGLSALTRKSSTNGGEWTGPCLRCHRLGVGKNENRFQAWPDRPVFGNGEYVCGFYCRRCQDEKDSSRPWTGDLVKFVQYAENCTLAEAKLILGIGNGGYDASAVRYVKPSFSPTGAPSDLWQGQVFDLIRESEDALWGTEGRAARNYLKSRGYTEEWLRAAHVGTVVTERYGRGLDYGLEKDVWIPRGICVPELHRTVVEGVTHREVWSAAIRRPDADAEDGRGKYHYLDKSSKGLYGADTIQAGQPVVLVEGALDQIAVRQATQNRLAACATQGTDGARHLTWKLKLAQASFVLLCFDNDAGGRSALAYWKEALEESLAWLPRSHDLAQMLEDGEDLAGFLEKGIALYGRYHTRPTEATVALSTQDAIMTPPTPENAQISLSEASTVRGAQEDVSLSEGQERASLVVDLQDTALVPTDHLSVILEASADTRCDGCGLLFDPCSMYAHAPSDDSREIDLLCLDCHTIVETPRCYGCSSLAVVRATLSPRTYWCDACYAAETLIEEGARITWIPLDCGDVHVPGGMQGYLNFITANERPVIAIAMQQAHDERMGWAAKDREIERKAALTRVPPEFYCARHPGGCAADYRRAVQMRWEMYTKKDGSDDFARGYRHPKERGRVTVLADRELHWCPRCYDCYVVMELGAQLGYRAFTTSTYTIGQGAVAWADFATHASEYGASLALDDLRRTFPQAWEDASEYFLDGV